MIKPPDNDRPIVETFPWAHVGVAAMAWSVAWFLVWSVAYGMPAAVIVSLVPDDRYRLLPHMLVGVFTVWLLSLVQTEYRLRTDQSPNPLLFAFSILLLLLWPPACYWARALLKATPSSEIGTSPVASGVRDVISGNIPWVAALAVTLAIGILANLEIAHAVYNRTGEARLNRGTLAFAIAVLPAILCAETVGTYFGVLVFGAASNALMLMWYRQRLKEELANNAIQRTGYPRHGSCVRTRRATGAGR